MAIKKIKKLGIKLIMKRVKYAADFI